MTSTIEVPEIVALYRDDEDEEQAVGWAMVLPETNKVVAYVPGWPTPADARPTRCCPNCTCAVVAVRS